MILIVMNQQMIQKLREEVPWESYPLETENNGETELKIHYYGSVSIPFYTAEENSLHESPERFHVFTVSTYSSMEEEYTENLIDYNGVIPIQEMENENPYSVKPRKEYASSFVFLFADSYLEFMETLIHTKEKNGRIPGPDLIHILKNRAREKEQDPF